jgi:FlaA1/EpsC-like NDP-sugar epimerase
LRKPLHEKRLTSRTGRHRDKYRNNSQKGTMFRTRTEEKYMSPISFSKQQSKTRIIRHRMIGYLLDWAAFALSGVFAFELRFDFVVPAHFVRPMGIALCVWSAAKVVAFILGKLDRGNWRYTSAMDAVRIILANTAGSIVGGVVLLLLLGPWGIPRSMYVLDWMISCLLTLGGRLVVRVFATHLRLHRRTDGERKRVLIYGTGAAGLALLWELSQNESLMCEVVGLIDDDPSKRRLILHGKPVLGSGEDIAALAKKYAIERVLIAIPSATGPQMVRILKLALDAGVDYKMVPGLGDLIEDAGLGKQLKDVAVEDLLGRKPVHLDQDSIRGRIQGKVVMVTGAAGSIGSEICRQIARFNPLALIGFDEAETPLFQIERELNKSFPLLDFHAELGSVTRPDRLRQVMQEYRPSILYHAAAYKHVPMMEKHVFAAVENNIFGTWQVAQTAIKHGVEDFVMISTDKAVRPTSMMGATKRIAEMVIRTLQRESGTKFVAVRFGNVLGSNGSVVPIFKEQIAAGGPVTVTHPEMCRYFMTIPEASQLVLQAFSFGKGGEVFVLDMGEPVKIVDLARNLILLSGLQPDKDIDIQFTGLRPGEKMFEELNMQEECLHPTSHSKIRSYICSSELNAKALRAYLQQLHQIVDEQDVTSLILLLKELIPDYNPGSRLLKAALSSKTLHPMPVEIGILAKQAEGSSSRDLALAARVN